MENTREEKILRPGQVNQFRFASKKTLGRLRTLILGAVERLDKPFGPDVRGHDAQWHCQEIVVTDRKTKTKYFFGVNSWVNITREISKREALQIDVADVEKDAARSLAENN